MKKAFKGGDGKWCCTKRFFADYNSYQCPKPAKHDPDEDGNPTKCGIHSSAAKEKREKKRHDEMKRRKKLWDHKAAVSAAKFELIPLVRSIANGHNDPRQACQEWLDRWSKLNEG